MLRRLTTILCPSVVAVAVAVLAFEPRQTSADPIDGNLSSPPSGQDTSATLSPAQEDEVRRLLKTAQELREKAEDLRVHADELLESWDLRNPRGEEEAEDLEERAQQFDDKAATFEEQAEEVAQASSEPKPREKGNLK